jgi:hypothetical protein
MNNVFDYGAQRNWDLFLQETGMLLKNGEERL